MNQLTLKKIIAVISVDDDELSTAMAHLLKSVINAVTNLENIKNDREKHEAKRKADPAAKIRPFPFLAEKIGQNL